jgi:hypothetical protein
MLLDSVLESRKLLIASRRAGFSSPSGGPKQAWREAAAQKKGGQTGEKERGLRWQTPFGRLEG